MLELTSANLSSVCVSVECLRVACFLRHIFVDALTLPSTLWVDCSSEVISKRAFSLHLFCINFETKEVFTSNQDKLRPAQVRFSLHTFPFPFLCIYTRPNCQRTQNGLTSSQFLDRDEKLSYWTEIVPFSCTWQQISDQVQKFQAFMLLGQRYILMI